MKITLLALLALPLTTLAQRPDTLVVMSYNVENLFHPANDPATNDDDFTPEGSYHWTRDKFESKCYNIARVIVAANGWRLPDVVGLCEVEGPAAARAFTETIFRRTSLRYEPLCFPSPDKRGVCTAMLYNPNTVQVLEARPLGVSLPDSGLFTRDVLYVKARRLGRNTPFHLLVNHWPSKMRNAWTQRHVAGVVRHVCDTLLTGDPDAHIVLMGDFNAYADEAPLTETLGAATNDTTATLRNLSRDVPERSYKYRGRWDSLDHIIVSPACCQCARPAFRVFNWPPLLQKDERNNGEKPRRTFIGPQLNRTEAKDIGYSDHLPVLAIIAYR